MKSLIALLVVLGFGAVSFAGEVCINNTAAEFTCDKVDLVSELNLNSSGIQTEGGNDIWGWTDSETGREYALMGLQNKLAVVDVTDGGNPLHVGDLPTQTYKSIWRDVKVYKDHAFVVSEAWGHGMQVLDLTQVRSIQKENMPVVFEVTAHYDLFGNAHNIAINEETGFAYAVGTSSCDRGAHVIDIRVPSNPQFATCVDRDIFEPPVSFDLGILFGADGDTYTHDIQCVVYRGPDLRYVDHEICVASNEDSVNVVDVTDKSNPTQISAITYSGVGYTHQGWLTEDHRFFMLGDELDEQVRGVNTTTFVFDMSDLENPFFYTKYLADSKAIDHNLYIKGDLAFQANYLSGLRILDISKLETEKIVQEVGFFDFNPESDAAQFEGVWSVYPYFESGNIIVSHIDGKLFVVKPSIK